MWGGYLMSHAQTLTKECDYRKPAFRIPRFKKEKISLPRGSISMVIGIGHGHSMDTNCPGVDEIEGSFPMTFSWQRGPRGEQGPASPADEKSPGPSWTTSKICENHDNCLWIVVFDDFILTTTIIKHYMHLYTIIATIHYNHHTGSFEQVHYNYE